MTWAERVRHIYGKEARALAPVLAASATVMVAALFPGPLAVERVSFASMAYVLGAIALGATAIGHEYSHKTLDSYLALPWRRTQLLSSKALVLMAFLAGHVGIALVVYRVALSTAGSADGSVTAPTLAFLESVGDARLWLWPPLAGFVIAPTLTILSRRVLAGVVFTLAIPTLLWLGSTIARAAAVGVTPATTPQAETMAFDVLWRVLSAVFVAFVPAAWWSFRRLEARGETLGETSVLSRAAYVRSAHVRRRRSGPLTALLLKELRLQQMAFAVSGLYVCMWAAAAVSAMAADLRTEFLEFLTTMYAFLLVILIGASASAEERALGTLAAQSLAPVPAWKQWAIKSLAAIGLGIVLGIALPALLDQIRPSGSGRAFIPIRLARGYFYFNYDYLNLAGFILLFTSFGLYVSSLVKGGLKALLLAVPLVVLFMITITNGASWTGVNLFQWLGLNAIVYEPFNPAVPPRWTRDEYRLLDGVLWLTWAGIIGCVTALLMAMGHRNHRMSDVEPRRARLQGASLAACSLLAAAAVGSVMPIGLWLLSSRG